MAAALLAALVPKGDPDLGVFIAIMGAGFVVGVAGHVVRSKTLVILGITLVFLATIALPLFVFGSGTD